MIVATITVCLWTKNESYYKQSNVDPNESNAVVLFAVVKALHALSCHCRSLSSTVSSMSMGEVASIVNKSLMTQVVINKQMVGNVEDVVDVLFIFFVSFRRMFVYRMYLFP